jgi:hypothetical protein
MLLKEWLAINSFCFNILYGAQGRHQTIVHRGLTLAVNIIVFLVLSLNPVFTRPHLCATIPVKVWDYMWDQSWAS